MPDHLTPVQRSVLLVLMAEAREVPNVDLTHVWKLKLEQKHRQDLEKLQFITVRTENRRLHLDLTKPGFDWCQNQLAAELPAGMGHGGAAAYALLGVIGRHLSRTGGSLTAFLAHGEGAAAPVERPASRPPVEQLRAEPAPADLAQAELAPAEPETLIRTAYSALATRPGDWVLLSALRTQVAELDRATVDRALIALNRAPDVSIEPESDQKTLTDRDWDAAVLIGNESKHVIAIGQS